MAKVLLIILTIISIVSLYEVFTTNNEDTATSEKNGEFDEFDEDPSYKYSEEAQESNDVDAEFPTIDKLEIRDPQERTQKFDKLSMSYPSVTFLFCVSCGYRQAFEQFSQILREKYPGIQIKGENYPPPTLKSILSQVVGIGKIILIIMIIMGRDPFISLGIQTPALFSWMLNNKFSSCLMIFLLSNSIEAMLLSTGAFEIFLGNENIWSKIESGRVPSPPELFQAIEAHMSQFNSLHGEFKDSMKSEGFIFNDQ